MARGSRRVGMVGAGQLARMTQQAAVDLDVELVVLANSEAEPAARAGATAVLGAPSDAEALERLAAQVDVVTFDHELIPAELVEALASRGHLVRPGAKALRLAQDKLAARRAFAGAGFPVPAFRALGAGGPVAAEVEGFAAEHGWPVVLKATRGGYDGRGVEIVRGPEALEGALGRLARAELMVEAFVEVTAEMAVVGARSPSGAWAVYPPVATLQRDGICHELFMPAAIDPRMAAEAEELAAAIAGHADATGILAVELFITAAGELVVNEIAVRPHNSGHATIEGAATSQFQNHLRAVLDWPLGDTSMRAPAAAMVNLLGPPDGSEPASRLPEALKVAGASVHLYGKASVPGRKIGHVTALGADPERALEVARRCARILTGEAST